MAIVDLSLRDNISSGALAAADALNKLAYAFEQAAKTSGLTAAATATVLPQLAAAAASFGAAAELVSIAGSKAAPALDWFGNRIKDQTQTLNDAAKSNQTYSQSLSAVSDQTKATANAQEQSLAASKSWVSQGLENITIAAGIEGSILAVASAFGIAKGMQMEWAAVGQDTSVTAASLTQKFTDLQTKTQSGTVQLSDFGTVLRDIGLSGAANAFGWLNNLSSGLAAAAEAGRQASQQFRLTRVDYQQMADEIKQGGLQASLTSSISQNDATAVAKTFAIDPNFNSAALGLANYITKANDLAAAMGATVPQAAQKLISAISDTAAAAKQAQDAGWVGFDSVLVKSIADAQAAGDRMGALSKYMQALGHDIDGAAAPLTPFDKAMRDFYAIFENRQASGTFDAFLTSIHNGLESIAAFTVRQLTTIVQAFLNAKDALTPSFLNPTAVSSSTQQLIANSVDYVAPQIGQNFSGDTLAAVQRLAPRFIQAESTDQQFGPSGGVLTSSAGALGLMQVMPSNAHGFDLGNAQGNVNAGMTLLYHLYQKYNGDLVKISIAYNWGETNADLFFMNTGVSLPQETLNFTQKITGLSQQALQTQLQTPLAAGAFSNKVTTDALALPVGNQSSNYGVEAQMAQNTAQQQLVNSALDKARNDLSVASNDDEVSNAITRIATLTEKLTALQAQMGQIDTETGKLASRQSGVAASSALTGLDKTVADIRSQFEAIAAKSGEPFDQANFDSTVTDKLTELSNGYKNATDAIVKHNTANLTLVDTYGKSDQAAKFAANGVLALNEAEDKIAQDDPNRTELIAERTKALNDATAAQSNMQAAIDVRSLTNQNDALQRQNDLLGQSKSASAGETAAIAERTKLGLALNDSLTEEQQKAIDLARANGDLKASYEAQRSTLNELSSLFTQSFDSVSAAITNAFVNGSASAVNFGNVIKSVISQIIADVLKLAIINPIINSVFSPEVLKPTLGSLFSGGSSIGGSSSGGSSVLSSLGSIGTLSSIGNALGLTGSNSLFGNLGSLGSSLGLTGSNGLFSGSSGLFSNGLSGVTSLLSTPLIGGYGASTSAAMLSADSLAGAYESGVGALAGPSLTIGGALSGVGLGYGAGSLLGGLLAGNSPARQENAQIGSGVGAAAGAAIGSIVPGVGTVIGGLLGGLFGGGGGGLIGPGPKNPFSATLVGLNNGQLTTGLSLSQVTGSNLAQSQGDVGSLNAYLAQNGLSVVSAGLLRQLGTGGQYSAANPGGYADPGKFTDLASAFPQLGFGSTSNSTENQFLTGKVFGSATDLQNWVTAFNAAQASATSFLSSTSDTLKNLGVTTGSVADSVNALNKTFADAQTSAEGLKASGYLSPDQIDQLTAAENQLSAARDKAVAAAYNAALSQVQSINQGLQQRTVAAILPSQQGLLGQQYSTTLAFDNSAQDQIAQLKTTLTGLYGDAFTSTTFFANEITALEGTLGAERFAIVQNYAHQIAEAETAMQQTSLSITSRFLTAQSQVNSSVYEGMLAALSSFDANTQTQRQQLTDQMTALYGQSIVGTSAYNAQMLSLENTLGEERLAITTSYVSQITAAQQAIANDNVSLQSRYLTAAGTISGLPQDQETAALYSANQAAAAERTAKTKSLTDLYGPTVIQSQYYANEMAALEKTLGEERLAIVKQYSDQIVAQQDQASQAAGANITSISSFLQQLQTGSSSPLSPTGQLALAEQQFASVAGKAGGGDYNSISSITSFANSLLSSSRAVYGSGTGYVADFNKVLDSLSSITQLSPDTLTASAFASETQTQTTTLVQSLGDVKNQLVAIRLQLQQGANIPKQLAAAA